MAEITTDLIKQLREKTSVGMMDCKKALQEADGDLERAIEILRKKGAAVAAKRAENATNHGVVTSFIAPDYHTGALVSLSCETDFAANTDAMKEFAAHLAHHAAQTDANETELTDQRMSNGMTVKEGLEELISKITENIKIAQVVRFAVDNNGIVNSYIHAGSTLGVMVQVAGASDLSGHKEKVAQLARDIAMQIAVTNPLCIAPSELDPAIVEKEKSVIKEQLASMGKSEAVIEKIMSGKLEKFYEDVCLLNQKYIKDDKLKINDVVENIGKEIGSKLTVARFVRFASGK